MVDEKKSSWPRAMGQFTADVEHGAAPTIVGGQPQAARRRSVSVPVGLEKVLYAAAANPAFRAALLRDREGAVKSAGLQLKPSELAMLRVAPESQLVAAIESLDVSAANVKRHSFMGKVATAAVTIAAGGAIEACNPVDVTDANKDAAITDAAVLHDAPAPNDSAGIRPEASIVDVGGFEAAPAGIRPDSGYVDVEGNELTSDGIRPDADYLDVESAELTSNGIRPDTGVVDAEPAETGGNELASFGVRPD